jgi:hypothetical protein
MMKPGMTYNQLRELEKCAPTPIEAPEPVDQESVLEIPVNEGVEQKIEKLRAKLMAARSQSKDMK